MFSGGIEKDQWLEMSSKHLLFKEFSKVYMTERAQQAQRFILPLRFYCRGHKSWILLQMS